MVVRNRVRLLVAGTIGSAALMAGAAAAHTGSAPVASQATVQHATLTADVTQAASGAQPVITYQQPMFFGLFSTSRQLYPGDVLTFSDNSKITVLPDYTIQYTDADGNVGTLTHGGVLQTPDGGTIYAAPPLPAPGQPVSDPASPDDTPSAPSTQTAVNDNSGTSGDSGDPLATVTSAMAPVDTFSQVTTA
jgi:hypothetical protein